MRKKLEIILIIFLELLRALSFSKTSSEVYSSELRNKILQLRLLICQRKGQFYSLEKCLIKICKCKFKVNSINKSQGNGEYKNRQN